MSLLISAFSVRAFPKLNPSRLFPLASGIAASRHSTQPTAGELIVIPFCWADRNPKASATVLK